MTEKVLIRLDDQFRLEVEATDPENKDSEEFLPVIRVHELTPYGMMLAGVGACTSMVVMTYAENHEINLDQVEIHLDYDRVFKEDCDNCQGIDRYDEHIYESFDFIGDLSQETKEKLLKIASHCPIEKMMKQGVDFVSEMG